MSLLLTDFILCGEWSHGASLTIKLIVVVLDGRNIGKVVQCRFKLVFPFNGYDPAFIQIFTDVRSLQNAIADGEKRAFVSVRWIKFGKFNGIFSDIAGFKHVPKLIKT